jgi:tetratricopeptide (TPR) repeat protein
MKKFFLSAFIMLMGFVAAANAQSFTSETWHKANEKMSQGDRAGAMAILDKAIEKRKDLLEAYQLRANLRSASGDLDGALADYTAALEINPNDAKIYERRAMFRMFQRDYAGALKDFDAAIANGLKSERVYTGRANIKRDMGDVEGAIADYQTAIAMNPNFALAYIGLSFTLERRGDVDAALAVLQEFLSRYESERDGKLPSTKNGTSGGPGVEIKREGKEKDGSQVYLTGEQFKTSSSPEKLEQILNLVGAYGNLGKLYEKKNDFDKAIENYEKGLRIRKDDAYIHKLRSEIRFKKGDLQGAIEDLTVVANSPTGAPDRHLDKGILLILQGKDTEAEKEFALHLQRFPEATDSMNKRIEEAKKLRSQPPPQ